MSTLIYLMGILLAYFMLLENFFNTDKNSNIKAMYLGFVSLLSWIVILILLIKNFKRYFGKDERIM